MMRTFSSTLQALSLLALLLFSSAGRGVDTEIYFNEVIGTQVDRGTVQGNLLFILDTSGSMGSIIGGTNPPVQRITALKSSMDTLLQEIKNLRVGVMTFNEIQGGSVRFPVAVTLDESVSAIVSEPGDIVTASTVNAGEDDVVQIGSDVFDGRVSAPLGDYATTLFFGSLVHQERASEVLVVPAPDAVERAAFTTTFSIGAEDTAGEGPHRAGLYFTGLDIPRGVTLASATLALQRSSEGSFTDGPFQPTIAINVVDARPLDLSDPNSLLARTSLLPDTTSTQSPDISTQSGEDIFFVTNQIQAVVNRADWTPGDALFLVLESTQTHRQLRYMDRRAADTDDWPFLNVAWVTTPPTIFQPADQSHRVGLRFTNVDAPQGTTIQNVSLDLGVLGEVTDEPTVWTIAAEDADNASAFTTADNNISGRTVTTAQASWTVPEDTEDRLHSVCLNGSCTGSTLTQIIQEVVNRTGWCGGNAINLIISATGTGNRRLMFQEGGNQTAATMTIAHDGSGNCRTGSNTLMPRSTNDIGTLEGSRFRITPQLPLGRVFVSGSPLNQAAAVIRFPNITIPQGSTINDARLTVTNVNRNHLGARTYRIRAWDIDNVQPLVHTITAISIADLTSATANLALPTATTATRRASTAYSSNDLSSVISEVVGRRGWTPGSALLLYIDNASGTSFNSATDITAGFGSASAPTLRIDFQSTTPSFGNTARGRLRALVNSLPVFGGTPTATTLYEAALYWRGARLSYGRLRHSNIVGFRDFSRVRGGTSRISHPGSYCSESSGTVTCTGTTIDATTDAYGVVYPTVVDNGMITARCTADNLAESICDNQEIKGNPQYLSPFRLPASNCAGSHQVLLSDGRISDPAAVVGTQGPATRAALGLPACETGDDRQHRCAVNVVSNLNTVDQSSTEAGDQTVTTHTIAFDLSGDMQATRQMRDLASDGGGEFYEARTATQLLDAFREITAGLISGAGSSVAAPSISTNSFNRLRSRDKIYFGMFDPDRLVSWEGNVRNYNICVDSSCVDTANNIGLGDLYDQNNMPVTDPDTGRFLLGSTSLWATAADGDAVTSGGAGGEDSSASALIYTDLQSDGSPAPANTLLSAADYRLTLSNWNGSGTAHIRQAVCGTRTEITNDSDCGRLMRWWLGVDTTAGSSDRWAFHDVLHSSPVSITYNGDRTTNTFVDRLLVGTNDGALRFINADDGTTQWRFYPNSTLPGLQALFVNAALPHQYGFDLTPTLQIRDNNSNGIINPTNGDFVRAFIGQRRGGSQLYALDLTPTAVLTGSNTVTPRVLWRITPATTGFARLGQTWSQPTMARVATSSGPRDVLIFGGGYDVRLDDRFQTGGFDPWPLGNGIYIVDASNGSLVLSITGRGLFLCQPACDGDIQITAMRHPIPGRVAVLDSNADGLDDRLYVGDTGGQVWRVDLAPNIGASGDRAGDTVVGRLANISTAGTAADERKFFERPSVVQVKDTTYSNIAGGEYDYVLIGSGDRPNPLDDTVTDRFYGFRDAAIGGLADADSNNQADPGYVTITESNLVDVTSTSLDATDATHTGARGWYVTMSGDGEKVYSSPTVISGAVLFTSYEPVDVGTECSINIGGGKAYNIDILTTKAAIDWDEDGTLEAQQDRSKSLGAGIPSSVLPLFTDEGVVGIVGIEGGAVTIGTLAALPRARTYWYQDIH